MSEFLKLLILIIIPLIVIILVFIIVYLKKKINIAYFFNIDYCWWNLIFKTDFNDGKVVDFLNFGIGESFVQEY